MKRTDHVRNVLSIIAIFLAAAWGLYTFYYEKIDLPKREPPFVSLTSSQEVFPRSDGSFVVRTIITVKNPSKARCKIIASAFNLFAMKTSFVKVDDSTFTAAIRENIPEFDRFGRSAESHVLVLQSGVLLETPWWLDPDEQTIRDFISIVPDTSFNSIRFRASLITGKETGGLSVDWQVEDDGSVGYEVIKLPEKELLDFEKHKSFVTENIMTTTFTENELPLIPIRK